MIHMLIFLNIYNHVYSFISIENKDIEIKKVFINFIHNLMKPSQMFH